MAEVTLADYAGYILREMVRAREMADEYSRRLAAHYGADPVLSHFAVPRFKTPKMELTIPVLVSGARFREAVEFSVPLEEFTRVMVGRAENARIEAELAGEDDVLVRPPVRRPQPTASLEELSVEFHIALVANPNPQQPAPLVAEMWQGIFHQALDVSAELQRFRDSRDGVALLRRTTQEVLAFVVERTVVSRTEIESLLVNPETHLVENDSSESSVFVVRAELVEEGFYLRSVRDESTGQTRSIVDFD